jgi:uncharacterized lipoprotein YmbA
LNWKIHRLAVLLCMTGCVSHRADHFYTLSVAPSPGIQSSAGGAFARQISLHLMLPSLVDRSELVLTSNDQVTILEHERWASPLPDQFTSVLGQDIEARRADLVITNRSLEQKELPLSRIAVEVVRIAAQRGGKVSLEARWRIIDSASGNATVGRDTFVATMNSGDYAQLASTLSQCIAQLAQRLIAELPVA